MYVQSFLLLFMSLLRASIVKRVIFWLEFTLSFWKDTLDQTWKSSNTKLGPQWKDQEGSSKVRQVFGSFFSLVALILGWNSVKGVRLTEFVKKKKKKKIEWVWRELKAKNRLIVLQVLHFFSASKIDSIGKN